MHECPRKLRCGIIVAPVLLLGMQGCQWFVNSADHDVYRLIEKRQLQALGETKDSRIDQEHVPIRVPKEAYSYVPNPIDPSVPPAFLTSTQPATSPGDELGPASSQPMEQMGSPAPSTIDTAPAESMNHPSVTSAPQEEVASQPEPESGGVATSEPAEPIQGQLLTLSDSLAYAFSHSREFQTAKEDLYLAALALTLERHLWTPQFTGNIGAQYANYGEIRNFDHAMASVAQVGVAQRLPLGGTVTATVIDNLMRDLTHHITSAENGQAVLAANIPLLKGAGLVAQETRFQAERNLIYAVRNFETFRRALSVSIAGDYFNLQQQKQAILNAQDSTKSLRWLAARARAYYRTGRVLQNEPQRAEQNVALAEIEIVDATASYRTQLDQFKLRIGMPTANPIDVPLRSEPGATTQPETMTGESLALEQALFIPGVSQEAALATALKYRLDLLNSFDRIDDAARGVNIAENNLLPALTATGSVAWDTDPNHLSSWHYNEDRATWRAALNLEIPLDRVKERNDLRSSLIFKRQAERDYQQARDTVVLQVRQDLRVIEQQRISLEIQRRSRDLALQRRQLNQILFLKSRVNILEVTDAEAALLAARNQVAQAEARLDLAILQFRRDTGTLRVDDQGKWTGPTLAGSTATTTRPSGT